MFDFDGTNWGLTQKLTAADGAANDKSISIGRSCSYRRFWGRKQQRFCLYIRFYGTSWNQTQKLTADDGVFDDRFGVGVSLSGDRALIGADQDDGIDRNSGSAYIFDFDGTSWNQSQKLTASDEAAEDRFGFEVSISGDLALIGARRNSENGDESGAYVFYFDGTDWSELNKLVASDGAERDALGSNLFLSGNVAFVGEIRCYIHI